MMIFICRHKVTCCLIGFILAQSQSPPLLILSSTILSSLLSALSRSQDKDAPYRANEVFDQMLGAGIHADPMAWTILITLWSKSALPTKEAKVQQIFKK